MKQTRLLIQQVPALLYGEESEHLWLYVHGKMGRKEEAASFAQLACPRGSQVLAIDLPEHGERAGTRATLTPWEVVPELRHVLAWAQGQWSQISLRATSLGTWFSLLAFAESNLSEALFLSPVLDMAQLIERMMTWAGVTEPQLQRCGEIPTAFGETLSWRYLQYAREHPVRRWDPQTALLYGGRDHLTDRAVVDTFVRRFSWELTVLPQGEHWFHTPEELAALTRWELAHL